MTAHAAGSPLPLGKLGFIGGGQMAAALARGFIQAGLAEPQQVIASDPAEASRRQFIAATQGQAVDDNAAVLKDCDLVFLAIKPQHLTSVASALRGRFEARHLVISILAGVSLQRLGQALGAAPRLIRVMPNTPCLIGAGASAFALGPNAAPHDGQLVQQLLESVGVALQLDEKLLDAVTGLSGSGPAFIYVMIEALADGGVRMGLPRDVALKLAAQTVAGAAQMVLQTGEHPAVLKDRVASPGGTTICGLQALEEHGLRGGLIAAVEAAANRSLELGA